MQENKVSIIVPVYNTKKYLSNCIDSIINQTYSNIEIILINDGSTDGSGKICDEYVKKYSCIKVIHQKNSGVSSARNVGMDNATGDYIQFVDSDDCIEHNMTERLVEAMDDTTQLVICGYKSIYICEDQHVIKDNMCPIEGKYQSYEFIKCFGVLFKEYFINSPCNKLYINYIIKKYNLHFIENLNMGEDLLFNLEYMKICEYIIIINDSLYNYFKFNSDSLTASFKKDLFKDQQMLYFEVRQFLLQNNYSTKKNKNFVEISYTDSIIGCLENLFHSNSNLTSKARKDHIRTIIYDDCVRRNIVYFRNANIQKCFIGFLIKYKLINGIYRYFRGKTFLRNSMKPLFGFLKKINNNYYH